MAEAMLTFLGGAREVGKSCVRLEAGGRSMLFDCGMKLTEPPTYPGVSERADALVLSHTHLDHVGYAPAVYRDYGTPVYATPVTLSLAQLILFDSVKVGGLKGYPARYTDFNVEALEHGGIPVGYGKRVTVGGGVSFTLHDAGHVPGAAGVLAEASGKTIFYAGDTKASETLLTKPAQYPKADVLVTESTYGDRLHPPRKDTVNEFVGAVENTLEAGGVALLPAFAVGRGQEIIMMLEKLDYPIYLDGMGTTVCNIFSDYPEFLRDFNQYEQAIGKSVWLRRDRERKRAVREPCVIVSSAGMLTGGPVLQHLKRLYKSPANSIILTGFQVEGTNGRRLVNEGVVFDEWSQRSYKVRCRVMQFDFSAHSDQDELLEMVGRVDPELVVCVHGEEAICETLAERLRSEGREAVVPEIGEVIEV